MYKKGCDHNGKLVESPKGDVYDPGVQVDKSKKPGVATSEGVVKNIVG